ncbi:MAG: HlyD family type I secretion periplasmic adaptor subunit [Rhodospirillales bacterium]|nr:HlyD family type I secretion periplasmic adaptor subunit [Alphaproteobacteria bacterium]USO06555.1 MAG: HlyD family type I secretion periplasmic adaptor subunit [Rhodospirillales bacterium]
MIRDYFTKVDDNWHYRPLLWLVVACLISFFIWASVTKIHEQVRGMGRVTPAGDTRVIQHLEGGIIEQIAKQEGEQVKKGDVIFYIKNQRAESEKEELQIALKSKEIKFLRLQAELGENTVPEFPIELHKNYPEIIQAEKQIFESRRSEMSEKMSGLEKRMRQKVLKLDDLSTTTENLEKELSVAQEQLEIRQKLRRSGAMSRSQYLETLSDVKNFETRVARTKKEIPIVKSELAEITNLVEETKQKWISETGEELNTVQVDIKKLKERIRAITDEVSRTAVKSPVNGIVNKIFINTIGGVLKPGDRLAEILPVEDKLVIEGRIPTNDRGKVWPDLPVVAKITAYDYTLYGGLKGKLVYISPNSFVDNQGVEYYEIRVEIDTPEIGKNLPVFPGMTAEINILAGRVSVLHAILKPFRQIRENALREK